MDAIGFVHQVAKLGYVKEDNQFCSYAVAATAAVLLNDPMYGYYDEPFGELKFIGGGVREILLLDGINPVVGYANPVGHYNFIPVKTPDNEKRTYGLKFANGVIMDAGSFVDGIVTNVVINPIPIDTTGLPQYMADLLNEVNKGTPSISANARLRIQLKKLLKYVRKAEADAKFNQWHPEDYEAVSLD